MNKITNKIAKPRHGNTQSYVIGFVLSLIFTLVPYQMVVNKTLTGSGLLVVILAFAFMQLAVQLLFFLHLGREQGPRWNLGFLVATFGAVLVVVVGSLWIIGHLQGNMLSAAEMQQRLVDDEAIAQVGGVKTGSCESVGPNHQVLFINGQASPSHIKAHLCDTLTFTNADNVRRDLAFGAHLHHSVYAGKTGMTLPQNDSWTITLSQPGSYRFHDHLHETSAGTFTVTP